MKTNTISLIRHGRKKGPHLDGSARKEIGDYMDEKLNQVPEQTYNVFYGGQGPTVFRDIVGTSFPSFQDVTPRVYETAQIIQEYLMQKELADAESKSDTRLCFFNNFTKEGKLLKTNNLKIFHDSYGIWAHEDIEKYHELEEIKGEQEALIQFLEGGIKMSPESLDSNQISGRISNLIYSQLSCQKPFEDRKHFFDVSQSVLIESLISELLKETYSSEKLLSEIGGPFGYLEGFDLRNDSASSNKFLIELSKKGHNKSFEIPYNKLEALAKSER